MAAGMGGELSHGEVLEVASASTERIVSLVGTLVRAA
jgi:purine nucleoside phosphorylase